MPQPPPQISDEARRAALAKAAAAKRARFEIKERLKAGELSLSELLSDIDDPIVARTKVLPILESLPQVGKVKARRTMESVGIAENRRLGGLGRKQRAELIEIFG